MQIYVETNISDKDYQVICIECSCGKTKRIPLKEFITTLSFTRIFPQVALDQISRGAGDSIPASQGEQENVDTWTDD